MTCSACCPAILAATVAFAAGPARAEMKNEWVEYSHGGMKLKAYMAYDDKITGKRPAVLVAHAREGMTPKTLQLTETLGQARLRVVRGRHLRLRPRHPAEERRGNDGADHDLLQGPPADARAHAGRASIR